MPWLKLEFAQDIEVRRLFWCYGYLREKVIPDDQLRWLWDTPHMPWEFHRDVARHLWDESRHGDSGWSRLEDFGIPLTEIGLAPMQTQPAGPAEPLSPELVFQAVYHIGYIAETGHFKVKQEGYQDFREGGDLESAALRRAECQAELNQSVREQAVKPKDQGYVFMRSLIERMRKVQPLTNAATCPPRSPLPM